MDTGKTKLTERWFMAFQDAFEELAKDREITNEPRRVLDYMFSKLDFENFINKPEEIIEILGINKSNVSKAIKLLTRKQIVLEGQKVGRSRCYRQPNYGWKGKVKNLQEYRREQFKKSSGRNRKDRKPEITKHTSRNYDRQRIRTKGYSYP